MSDTNIVIENIGGFCPVQAEGSIDGKPFYFRARGSHWSLSIGGEDVVVKPEWYHEEGYGEGPFDAGWMELDEARSFIRKGAGLYRQAIAAPDGTSP